MSAKKQQSKLLYCSQCDYVTRETSCLRSHERTHKAPGGEGSFKCPHCNFSSYWKASIKAHIASKHNADKRPYVCTYKGCDKGFKDPAVLKIHLRTHTGEKPYRCRLEGCEEAYTQRNGLRYHLSHGHDRNQMAAEIRRMYLAEAAWGRREKVLKDEIAAFQKKLEKANEKMAKLREKFSGRKAAGKRKAAPKRKSPTKAKVSPKKKARTVTQL